MSQSPELWRTVRWALFLLTFALLALLGAYVFQQSVTGTASGIERGLDKVLGALTHSNTRVVEGRAVIASQKEISELSLLELRMSATRSFENESYVLRYLPAGTKRIIVRGDYRVTAGYKLKPGVSLRIEDGVPVASFPEPEILSVELIDHSILSEKDGWANSITAADRATLLRELRLQMRREAEKSGILELADSALRTRLKDLIGTDNVRMERPPKTDRATVSGDTP